MASRYLQAGSPICCFLPSCRRPFLGKCVRANDGRFYCSNECADEGDKIDLTHVAPLKRAKGYEIRG
jgi:hypothetical protein